MSLSRGRIVVCVFQKMFFNIWVIFGKRSERAYEYRPSITQRNVSASDRKSEDNNNYSNFCVFRRITRVTRVINIIILYDVFALNSYINQSHWRDGAGRTEGNPAACRETWRSAADRVTRRRPRGAGSRKAIFTLVGRYLLIFILFFIF